MKNQAAAPEGSGSAMVSPGCLGHWYQDRRSNVTIGNVAQVWQAALLGQCVIQRRWWILWNYSSLLNSTGTGWALFLALWCYGRGHRSGGLRTDWQSVAKKHAVWTAFPV
nr:hypothetical protein [Acetobacter pomorum]